MPPLICHSPLQQDFREYFTWSLYLFSEGLPSCFLSDAKVLHLYASNMQATVIATVQLLVGCFSLMSLELRYSCCTFIYISPEIWISQDILKEDAYTEHRTNLGNLVKTTKLPHSNSGSLGLGCLPKPPRFWMKVMFVNFGQAQWNVQLLQQTISSVFKIYKALFSSMLKITLLSLLNSFENDCLVATSAMSLPIFCGWKE